MMINAAMAEDHHASQVDIASFQPWILKDVAVSQKNGILQIRNLHSEEYGGAYIPLALNGPYNRYEISIRDVHGVKENIKGYHGYFSLTRIVRGNRETFSAKGMEFTQPGKYYYLDKEKIIQKYYRSNKPTGPVQMDDQLIKYQILGKQLEEKLIQQLPPKEHYRMKQLTADIEWETQKKLVQLLKNDQKASGAFDAVEELKWQMIRELKETNKSVKQYLENVVSEKEWILWRAIKQSDPRLKEFMLSEATMYGWQQREKMCGNEKFCRFFKEIIPAKRIDLLLELYDRDQEKYMEVWKESELIRLEMLAEAQQGWPGLEERMKHWRKLDRQRRQHDRLKNQDLNKSVFFQGRFFSEKEGKKARQDKRFRGFLEKIEVGKYRRLQKMIREHEREVEIRVFLRDKKKQEIKWRNEIKRKASPEVRRVMEADEKKMTKIRNRLLIEKYSEKQDVIFRVLDMSGFRDQFSGHIKKSLKQHWGRWIKNRERGFDEFSFYMLRRQWGGHPPVFAVQHMHEFLEHLLKEQEYDHEIIAEVNQNLTMKQRMEEGYQQRYLEVQWKSFELDQTCVPYWELLMKLEDEETNKKEDHHLYGMFYRQLNHQLHWNMLSNKNLRGQLEKWVRISEAEKMKDEKYGFILRKIEQMAYDIQLEHQMFRQVQHQLEEKLLSHPEFGQQIRRLNRKLYYRLLNHPRFGRKIYEVNKTVFDLKMKDRKFAAVISKSESAILAQPYYRKIIRRLDELSYKRLLQNSEYREWVQEPLAKQINDIQSKDPEWYENVVIVEIGISPGAVLNIDQILISTDDGKSLRINL